jgi:hypothetical protein
MGINADAYVWVWVQMSTVALLASEAADPAVPAVAWRAARRRRSRPSVSINQDDDAATPLLSPHTAPAAASAMQDKEERPQPPTTATTSLSAGGLGSRAEHPEELAQGAMPWRVYGVLLLFSGGVRTFAALTALFAATEAVRVSADLWLALWSSPAPNPDAPSPTDPRFYPRDPPPFGATLTDFFLWIFFILGLGYCALAITRNRTPIQTERASERERQREKQTCKK